MTHKCFHRIRKKGDYIVLEWLFDGKCIRSMNLNADELAELYECPDIEEENVSTSIQEILKEDIKKFA